MVLRRRWKGAGNVPQRLKPQGFSGWFMYGLKPVPFKAAGLLSGLSASLLRGPAGTQILRLRACDTSLWMTQGGWVVQDDALGADTVLRGCRG